MALRRQGPQRRSPALGCFPSPRGTRKGSKTWMGRGRPRGYISILGSTVSLVGVSKLAEQPGKSFYSSAAPSSEGEAGHTPRAKRHHSWLIFHTRKITCDWHFSYTRTSQVALLPPPSFQAGLLTSAQEQQGSSHLQVCSPPAPEMRGPLVRGVQVDPAFLGRERPPSPSQLCGSRDRACRTAGDSSFKK